MIHINLTICKTCGVCAKICPRYIPVLVKSDAGKTIVISPERASLCMDCGHCAAVCPNGAILVDGLAMSDYGAIPPLDLKPEQLLYLMERRRTVRRYKDKPVPREIINQILEAAQRAPTGSAKPSNHVIVIDVAEKLEVFRGQLHQVYNQLEGLLKNPLTRFFIKWKIGATRFNHLTGFVMPGMLWYLKWYRAGQGDEITRNAKAVILFHSPVNEPAGDESCFVAATHAVLMAELLGLGTCINGLIPPACNRSQEIRDFLRLPKNHEVYASLTLGYPKHPFQKTIKRRLAEIRYLD